METIIVENQYLGDPDIALVTLNRPKVLNAINNQLFKELVLTIEELESNSETKVIIITGSKRAFAAGADIQKLYESGVIDQYLDERATLWKRLNLITKPIIAAVDGFCLGGGHELAMSCDFIIASHEAKFGQPEIKIGTIPGAGGTQRLTRTIGKSKAMMLALTGEMFTAKEALDWGLIAKTVPSYTLLRETYEIAKLISKNSTVAVKLAKESIKKSFEMPLNEGLDFERRNFYLTFASKDQKEGMSAFLEKRKPTYKGN
ncbi:MAG: enoyl-CoA hydratase/isomerase family protein [Bacteriovoracaceae bacterium]|nr:enoyl-CoA hydratase/isomerase family protein [Bacteriovoracaceae bacterium]